MLFDAAYDEAIKEVSEQAAERRIAEAKKANPLLCPDCGAELAVEKDEESPHGVRIIHVRHRI